MPALVGRLVTFTPTGSGIPLTGMRAKTITVNNEAIDITTDDDNGWQTFLNNDPAVRGVNMDVSGITKDGTLMNLAMTGGSALVSEYELNIPGIGTFTGDFHIGTVTMDAKHDAALEFSCTIRSSGEPTWVPA